MTLQKPLLAVAFFSLALNLATARAEERPAPRKILPGPLLSYVQKPDPTFQWKVRSQGKVGQSRYAELIMTSQKWRDIDWKHQLFLINPSTAKPSNRHALLFITGGRWKKNLEATKEGRLPREAALFATLAEQLKTPVAVLLQVPFQPIFEGRVEDQIIALTFKKYMESGDGEWPLLVAMVKSAVRGMDTVQAYTKKNWNQSINSFTISGASKRGWTTWLTGAVDRRATAIAPMVIDMLNMSPQLQHQVKVWGDLSYKIGDYSELKLPEKMDTPRGKGLARIVDPYHYRKSLTQSKLIILGTNDHYWPVDALNLYWEGLVGRKHVLYVPNNRHSLKDLARVTGSLTALHHRSQAGRSLPNLTWTYAATGTGLRLEILSDEKPQRVDVWSATSPNRDFRKSNWQSKPTKREGKKFVYQIEPPASGYAAVFGEAVYAGQTLPFYLSTTLRVLASKAAAQKGGETKKNVGTKASR